MSVSALVLEYGGDEDQAIAALLHDAIEDGQQYHQDGAAGVRAEIRARFGESVLVIVEGCTDAEVSPKPPWRARKQAYTAHLADASPAVRLVSCADKLHNARCILADYRHNGEELWGRFNEQSGGRNGQLWYYRSLVAAFNRLGPIELAAELARTVSALADLIEQRNSCRNNQ